MNIDEFQGLNRVEAAPLMIRAQPGPDRTLLYGYDVDRLTHHVFQRDGLLHKVVYAGTTAPVVVSHDFGSELNAASLPPNKRLYPEACDAAFCRLLMQMGVHLSFTTFGNMAYTPRTDFFGFEPNDESALRP